jgi:hypothetical protein
VIGSLICLKVGSFWMFFYNFLELYSEPEFLNTLKWQLRPNSESKEGTCEPAQGFNINSTQFVFIYN